MLFITLLVLVLGKPVLSARLYPRQYDNGTSISVTPDAANTTIGNANSTTIVINDNQTSTDPLDIKCASFQKLSALSSLTANSTLLQLVSQRNNLTAAQTAALRASAKKASAQLTALEASNTTLASTCTTSLKVSTECTQLNGLKALDAIANNSTKLAALKKMQNLTQTEVSELQAAAMSTKPLLQTLQANQTLVNECSKFDSARAAGQGIAEAAGIAVGRASGNGTGNANSANGTTTASGVAGATGTPISPTAAAQTSPIQSKGGAGTVPVPRLGYELITTAFFVAVGIAVLV